MREKTKQVNIRVTPSVAKRLQRVGRARSAAMSEVVRQLAIEGLERAERMPAPDLEWMKRFLHLVEEREGLVTGVDLFREGLGLAQKRLAMGGKLPEPGEIIATLMEHAEDATLKK